MKTELFYFVLLISLGLQLRADFFDIETESDIRRIGGSFIDFYNKNYDFFQNHSTDLKKYKKDFFRNLSSNGSIFATLYGLDPNGFRRNFFELRKDIIENSDRWEKPLGKSSFELFISGVYYLQKVFF